MDMAGKRRVVIIGAGLVGSLCARLLAERGARVDVYDHRGAEDGLEHGDGGQTINLSLSGRGASALRWAGVWSRLSKAMVSMDRRVVHQLDGGVQQMRYGSPSWRNYSVSRADLLRELRDHARALPTVHFHFGERCLEVKRRRALIERQGQVRHEEADLVIGADGAFSTTRAGFQRAPGFDVSQKHFHAGYRELTIDAEQLRASRDSAATCRSAIHIWPRPGYFMVALPNVDQSLRATLVLPNEGPIGFGRLNNARSVRRFFERYFPDVADALRQPVAAFLDSPPGRLVTVDCNRYHIEDWGLLVGDAAHAMVPFLGQGVNVGFEDAVVLAQLLDRHPNNLGEVLSRFSAQRVPDASAASALSIDNFGELAGREASALQVALKRMQIQAHRLLPDWIDPPAVVMVNFLDVRYTEALDSARWSGAGKLVEVLRRFPERLKAEAGELLWASPTSARLRAPSQRQQTRASPQNPSPR